METSLKVEIKVNIPLIGMKINLLPDNALGAANDPGAGRVGLDHSRNKDVTSLKCRSSTGKLGRAKRKEEGDSRGLELHGR